MVYRAESTDRFPAWVLHRSGDKVMPVELGQELHDAIPGTGMVEFPGADHLLPTTDWAQIIDTPRGVRHRPPGGGRGRPLPGHRAVHRHRRLDPAVSALGDQQWQHVLAPHDALAHREIERLGGRVVHGTGDGLLAVFVGPSRAIRAAVAITDQVSTLGVQVRAGLHTGEIIQRPDGDLAGLAVHIAARIANEAGADEVLVSTNTADLVLGSSLSFDDAGTHHVEASTAHPATAIPPGRETPARPTPDSHADHELAGQSPRSHGQSPRLRSSALPMPSLSSRVRARDPDAGASPHDHPGHPPTGTSGLTGRCRLDGLLHWQASLVLAHESL